MKKIWLLILFGSLFVAFLPEGRAETITYKRLDNIYFNLNVGGSRTSNHVTQFFLDDRLAYCLEPGQDITVKEYDSFTSWQHTGLSFETQKYLEKIGYYGYEYPGHQTPKYYIATQELIWKAFDNVDIYWSTQINGGGDIIDISKEKNDILKLVEQHDLKPSFMDETIIGEAGSTKVFQDDNKVLENFEIVSTSKHQLEIIENSLSVTFADTEVPAESLILKRKNYDAQMLLIYQKASSQMLGALRLSYDEPLKLTIQNFIPEEDIPEIVKVPNTAFQNVKHFNVTWTIPTYVQVFN